MLNTAVKKYKGEEDREDFETVIDISVNAFIPPSYIANEMQKLDMYKKIAAIESEEEKEDIMDEMQDRYGDLPKNVENLLNIASLKCMAHRAYVTEVSDKSGNIRITMYERAKIKVEEIPSLLEKFQGSLSFKPEQTPYFVYQESGNRRKEKTPVVETVRRLLSELIVIVQS